MINASKEFRNLINKGVKVVNYADITLRDGTVLNLEPSDFSVGGFSMTDKTSNGKFEIGTAIAKTISATIANHTNKFSAYDFYKSIIYMYVAVEKEDGTVLKERKGKYYVINPVTPNDTIKLSGVDSMCLFDKPYNANTAFPATLQTILSDCCLDCGVNIGFEEFDNWNFVVMNKPEDCTYRQVVSWVAQIAGCHARINNNDYLELVWYDTSSLEKVNIDGGNYFVYENENIIDGGDFTTYESDLIIDGGNFTDYSPPNVTKIKPPTVSTDNVVITGVKVEYNKKEVILGNEDYLIIVKDNPFVDGKENEVCQYLADRMIGLSFRPLSCQMVNNPLFEPFDSCYVYDRKGNAYFTLINSVTYTISGFTTLSCNADDPVRNESSYVSESAKAIVQAKRETANQLTLYDKAVQNMNLLAANSMGLYRESEIQSDGSAIYYMSNRPIVKNEDGTVTLEENSVVYKMTGNGFFVSEDGGITFTAGFDSEGNAIVNVLSAIGITFDWAKGGTLSLGGDNNINGAMVVYDAEGNIVGKFNKDGLWAENGYFKGTIESTDATITGGTINIQSTSLDQSSITLHYLYDFSELSHRGLRVANADGNYEYSELLSSSLTIDDSTNKVNIIPSLISVESSNNHVFISDDKIHISVGSKLTSIGIDSVFARDITVGGDISAINGKISCKELFVTSGIDIDELDMAGNLSVGGNITMSNALKTLTIEGNSTFKRSVLITGTATGISFKVDCDSYLNGNCYICSGTSDKLSFFGGTAYSKQTVSTITTPSTASASTIATKVNDVINALKKYNLL